jgi:hypothetical protein
MTSTITGLKFVTYTISGEANYSRMTPAELETLRMVAAKSEGVLVITGVKTDRRRSVR